MESRVDRKKRGGSQLAGLGGTLGRRVICVIENLPIKLSVESSLLTDAFGGSGCFLGNVLQGSGQGWDSLCAAYQTPPLMLE